MKNLVVLGSTGSIGTQTLDIVRNNPKEYNIIGLSCKQNIELLEKQIREFNPKVVAVEDSALAMEFGKKASDLMVEVLHGIKGVSDLTTLPETDLVVNAVVGVAGLIPTITAIQNKRNIALANKETLVTAGETVMEEAQRNNVKIIPVDSEHNAIFQCLSGNNLKDIDKIILTASGGPFRGFRKDQLETVTVRNALKHPKWNMGKKISIDSATMMNKGLEVIEAKWLFDVEVDHIDVVIHPQSIIHSMVEYKDGSIIAQMSNTDMRIPIEFALSYPKRATNPYNKLDLVQVANLSFEKPDMEAFPCLKLAYEAIKIGGSLPIVLNAANEEVVELFLKEQIGFNDIPNMIEKALEKHEVLYNLDIDSIIDIDTWARKFIQKIIT